MVGDRCADYAATYNDDAWGGRVGHVRRAIVEAGKRVKEESVKVGNCEMKRICVDSQ